MILTPTSRCRAIPAARHHPPSCTYLLGLVRQAEQEAPCRHNFHSATANSDPFDGLTGTDYDQFMEKVVEKSTTLGTCSVQKLGAGFPGRKFSVAPATHGFKVTGPGLRVESLAFEDSLHQFRMAGSEPGLHRLS